MPFNTFLIYSYNQKINGILNYSTLLKIIDSVNNKLNNNKKLINLYNRIAKSLFKTIQV